MLEKITGPAKILGIGFLVGVIIALGFLNRETAAEREEYRRQLIETQTELERRVKEKTEKDRDVTTVEKRPDGTVITTREKTKEKTKVSDNTSVKENVRRENESVIKINNLERYSVGLYYSPISSTFNADIGARLGNLPIEAVILSTDNFTDISIGARFRW